MIYLDNAATTLIKPDCVREAMTDAFGSCASVGRGGYNGAMAAAERVFTARERAADFFGVEDASQVVFTHNATHALNIAIKGVLSQGNCVVSGYEHNSVIRPLYAMRGKRISYTVAEARLFDQEGMVKSFERAITRKTTCAVCTHMSNVFGYILPIREIDALCEKKGIPLIIDASQSAGSARIRLSELRAAVCICAPGHKGLYGPQGTGLLLCKNGEKLKTFTEGGTGSLSSELRQPSFMPDRFESGTQNVPGIAGLSEGIAFVADMGTDAIMKHERELVENAAKLLARIPGISVYASRDCEAQGGVLSFSSDRIGADDMAHKLGVLGIAVRGGMHCAPTAHRTVGSVFGTVRASFGIFSTEEEAEKLAAAVGEICRR